jgi:hypothetical protein
MSTGYYPSIQWDASDLYAQDARIDTLRKPGQSDYSLQATAADKKIWNDLANRQQPIRPEHVSDHRQLNSLKIEWMLHLIYQGAITSGNGADKDRNAYLAQDHETRYRTELLNVHIEVGGARVRVQRKTRRC